MKYFALLLFFFCRFAFAVDAYLCEPSTAFNDSVYGTKTITTKTDYGTVDAWFCFDQPTSVKPHTYVLLNKYKKPEIIIDILRRISAAPDILAAINAELANGSILPAVGTTERFQYDTLRYMGCKSLFVEPTMVKLASVPPNICGQQPTPPVVGPDVYKTGSAGSILFKLLPNGNVDTVISGRKAAANVLCDCIVKTTIGGNANYCPLSGQLKTEVASCIKQ